MNKSFKKLIIPLLIILLITNTLTIIITYRQQAKLNKHLNYIISSIVAQVQEKYPEVDSEEIINILNNTSNRKNGEKELKKYGIDLSKNKAYLSLEKDTKANLILNCIMVTTFGIIYVSIFILYIKNRNNKISEMTQYINEINDKNYTLKIDENSEDELSNLRNDLYKITIFLKEETERSNKDKQKLKTSLEDISHQLKTPLTSISIMLDNLIQNPEMDKQTRTKFIYKISEQIEGINFLVISLLKLTKIESYSIEFQKQNINVAKLINESVKKLEIPLEIKKQEVIINGSNETTFIGDYKWQTEAITNIIKNCIEHTPNDKKIYINFEENNLFTKITIRDEGEGIDKKDIRHIFERFYKGTNSSDNSFGIGLALSKSIIERDNGYIKCESKVGEGTTFIIKYMK